MQAARVVEVEHLGGRVLRVVFSDGLVRELDFAGTLPGVLAIVDDDDVFPDVTVDAVARTVTWLEGVDFDPGVLHGDETAASGTGPRVLREYHRASLPLNSVVATPPARSGRKRDSDHCA